MFSGAKGSPAGSGRGDTHGCGREGERRFSAPRLFCLSVIGQLAGEGCGLFAVAVLDDAAGHEDQSDFAVVLVCRGAPRRLMNSGAFYVGQGLAEPLHQLPGRVELAGRGALQAPILPSYCVGYATHHIRGVVPRPEIVQRGGREVNLLDKATRRR